MPPLKHSKLYIGPLITIQVGSTLFQVPRKKLEQSEVFKNMFAMPPGEGLVPDGQSDEQPLHLKGISARDFRSFLEYLYPGLGGALDDSDFHMPVALPSESDLVPILALAKMWCFEKIQEKVIKKLDNLNIAPARKLEIARTYDIRHWYKPALENLSESHTALTETEMAQVGTNLTLIVLRLKDIRLEGILRYREGCRCKKNQKNGLSGSVKCGILNRTERVEIDTLVQNYLEECIQSHGWDK